MKKHSFLTLFIVIVPVFLNTTTVFASALMGASCNVTAEVVDRGTETRKAYGSDGDVSRVYESEYLKVEILTTKRSGVFGNCDFVSRGDIFKIVGGSNPDPLNAGNIIEAGLEASSAMTPVGIASSFIHWEPVVLISPEKTLRPAFHLQSSNEPEKQVKDLATGKQNEVGETDAENDDKDVADNLEMEDYNTDVIANDGPPVDTDGEPPRQSSIIIATVILIVGGAVYLFSHQRKT